jgi:hypothetical protein
MFVSLKNRQVIMKVLVIKPCMPTIYNHEHGVLIYVVLGTTMNVGPPINHPGKGEGGGIGQENGGCSPNK